VHLAIMLGGAMREAAVAFCAFALLVGAPIAILAWFGSLSDAGEKSRRQRQQLKRQTSEADLWRRTLLELQPYTAVSDDSRPIPASHPDHPNGLAASDRPVAGIKRVPMRQHRARAAAERPVLGHLAIVATVFGLMGCATDDHLYAWQAVRPGMGTAELTALVGAPQQIKSNGTVEVWQYCPGNFFVRDGMFDQFERQPLFKQRAGYYVAVWIDNEQVREVKPYPVASNASCADFFQTVW